MGASYREQVLAKTREICSQSPWASVSGSELVDELPHIPRGTVFALIGRLVEDRKLVACLFKEPRGVDGRRVTVYQLPEVKVPTIAEKLSTEANRLEAAAKRLQGLVE